jgi:hypothetical protein
MINPVIVTALFDINRKSKGDGRSIDDYLVWFKQTLSLKCDMIIYTEERFKQFIESNRTNRNKTEIIIQKLEEIPFYNKKNEINELITSVYFKSKMKDLNRIECYLPEYNIIQYSKFGWLKIAAEKFEEYNYFFWMDAGCSRFFDGFDLNLNWPNTSKLPRDRLTIQGNSNYLNMFKTFKVNEYIWDNNSMLVGTLFGGGRTLIYKLYEEIELIYNCFVSKKCINNEQFALAIFAKAHPSLVNIIINLNDKHLPLFKMLV